MKKRNVVITSLPQAYHVIKEMNLDTEEADYRGAGRQALEAILEGRMQERRIEETGISPGTCSPSSGISSFLFPAPDGFLPYPYSVPMPAGQPR